MKRLVIIASLDEASEDERLSELANFVGVVNEVLPLERGGRSVQEVLYKARSYPCSLAMHVKTLEEIYRTLNAGTTLRTWLEDHVSEILVYGSLPKGTTSKALENLTGGMIDAPTTERAQTVRYSLPYKARELSAQLAGQTLLVSQQRTTPVIDCHSEDGSVESIIKANGRPIFARCRLSSCNLFLLPGPMPDLRKPLGRKTADGDDFIEVLAPLIFLRHCFPQSCWRSEEATARLIIDDPILTKSYGALHFESLKASMQRLKYGTSIAFIPWNYWRSSRRSAARLLTPDSNLSICVHGCDHTNHEFRSGSAAILAQKAALGFHRMEKHKSRVGVPFEDVMIFPQGQFSKAAIHGLRSANYLATVNSTCLPTDCQTHDLEIADFLMPAVTRYHGFPVYQRRYPQDTFNFALDLFLGKPAIIGEHHDYFRHGCQQIEDFVAALHRIEPRLSWPSLSQQLLQNCMKRSGSNGSTEVRFFTRRHRLMAKEGENGSYRLSKFEPNAEAIEKVLVDGERVSFGFEKEHLAFEVHARPGQVRNIEIVDRTAPASPIRSFGTAHNARVLIRRELSEFRDSTLWRHKRLMKVANRLAKAMKVTWNG